LKAEGVARSIGDDARHHAKQRCGLPPGLVLGYPARFHASSGVMLVLQIAQPLTRQHTGD